MRASCPRIRQCSPVVAPKSPQASALAPKATSVMPGFSARSPTAWRASCPSAKQPNVLELGCGTGLFSRHLLTRYPEGRFVLTDARPAMIAECRRNLRRRPARPCQFRGDGCGRGRRPCRSRPHRLEHDIALARGPCREPGTLAKRLLAPSGILLYATLGPDSFAEWRGVLAREGLPSGLAESNRSRRSSRKSVWRPIGIRSRFSGA